MAEASPKAAARGVWRGMSLAEARALCPGLTCAPHEPEHDLRALEALGRWLMRFSPVVAVEGEDALFLDVGGCERLFGGLDKLLRQVSASLASLRISASVAIAPTPGSAWAIAGFCDGRIVAEQELPCALAPLPPAALRIDPAVAATLGGLGIDSIGRLMALPRAALPVRFGPDLSRRLDQALGRCPEPLAALEYRSAVRARIEWDGPVDALETIWEVLKGLVEQLVVELARRGCGARRLEAWFLRKDMKGVPPVHKTILLSRPSREPGNLFNLLRCALETVRTGEGFTGIQLDVPVFERLAEEQARLAGTGGEEQEAEMELAHMIERLRARLEPGAVQGAELVESYLPERAYRVTRSDVGDGGNAGNVAGNVGRALARVSSSPAFFSIQHSAFSISLLPLRLLSMPVEVRVMVSPGDGSEDAGGRPLSFSHEGRVYRLAHVIGPERIAGVWWEGHNKTRDYFDVVDDPGRRFWVFRVVQTGRWYLHGVYE